MDKIGEAGAETTIYQTTFTHVANQKELVVHVAKSFDHNAGRLLLNFRDAGAEVFKTVWESKGQSDPKLATRRWPRPKGFVRPG